MPIWGGSTRRIGLWIDRSATRSIILIRPGRRKEVHTTLVAGNRQLLRWFVGKVSQRECECVCSDALVVVVVFLVVPCFSPSPELLVL